MSDRPGALLRLSDRRQALLSLLLRAEGLGGEGVGSIPRADRARPLPLSFAQERLWFLDQLMPGTAAYNIAEVVELRGPLHQQALKRSLRALVRRHEALRTRFVMVEGRPVEVVEDEVDWELAVVDLRASPAEWRAAEALRLATAEVRRPFHLSRPPLARAVLVRVEDEVHLLVLVLHHIAADGWSVGVLWRELSALYAAGGDEGRAGLSALSLQYGDFAIWQREQQGEALAVLLRYWQGQFAGAPVLALPTDRPRPAVAGVRGAHHATWTTREILEGLRVLSRSEGATLFMTLLAAFGVLLARYSGQTDIVVGTPVAGRVRPELEGLIGCFVNMVALRLDVSGDPTFRELLGRVREVCLGTYAHQELPFEKLVEALQPERSLSHTPLFQVLFVLQNVPRDPLRLRGVEARRVPMETGASQFDLSLIARETETGLVGVFNYRTDLFEAATIERLAGHWVRLLVEVVAAPDHRVSAIRLLSEEERHRLMVQWNATAAGVPERLVPELVVAQAALTPDAVAVTAEHEHLTYDELDRRANRLAHYLQRLGVGPEVLVGLCVDRSPELVIGLLGILKAGGAYLPLDPDYPAERLGFMVADSRASVVLTHEWLLVKLPAYAGRIVCLDREWPTIARESDAAPDSGLDPRNLAYAIYTSGSTGRPKGVMIEHRGLVNLAEAQARTFNVQVGDRVLQFASLSFDASMWEILMALRAGATLCLVNSFEVRAPGPTLALFIRRHAITHATFPPSVISAVPRNAALPALGCLIVAGEACQPDLVLSWAPGRRFFNAYGPTEATVCATIASCGAEHGPPPIGRPIANAEVYVLDAHGQLLPVGVAGELYIGGVGVGRGYVNRADLTAERFVPDPFSGRLGTRLYRTGDVVRWRADGQLEYLGRLDDQVKIRGFRIELREVETVLREHPRVREAAVAVREDVPGDKRLVAYIVPGSEPGAGRSDLRSFLRVKLPEYMVPAAFVMLEALPRTANGKVDRKGLPAPSDAGTEVNGTFVGPRDSWELRLAQIWEDLLNTHPVQVIDSFFDLGGHSLLAVALMARIRAVFGQQLSLSALFQEPTIEYLAGILRLQSGSVIWSPLVPIRKEGSKPPLFCVHPVGGHVLCYLDLARQLGRDQPFYGLVARGIDDEQEPFDEIEGMARHYVDALRVVQWRGPYFLGGWSLGGIVAFEMARQLKDRGEEVALLALIDTRPASSADRAFGFDPIKIISSFVKDFAAIAGRDLRIPSDVFIERGSEPALRFVWDQARALKVMPPDADFAVMQRLLRSYEANLRALSRYVPRVGTQRITFFRTSAGLPAGGVDASLGWNRLTTAGVDVHMVSGDHYAVMKPPHVQVLAGRLRACIDATVGCR